MATQISTANLPTLGFRNKIINGNFDFWQRGTSFNASNAFVYTADRWFGNNSAGTVTVSRQDFTVGQSEVPNHPKYYLRFNIAAVGSGNVFGQRIEDVRTLAGKSATLSFYAKSTTGTPALTLSLAQRFGTGGTPSGDVNISGTSVQLSTSWTKFKYTFVMPGISGKTIGTNEDSYIQVEFTPAASIHGVDLALVQFEEGEMPTEFEQRHPQQELALCQRYYEKSYNLSTAPGTALNSIGMQCMVAPRNTAGQQYAIAVEFATVKRAMPVVTLYSYYTGAAGFVRNNSANTDDAALATNIGTHSYVMSLSAMGDQNPYAWQWAADSEL